jgi:predicted dithiol-disulfide oxidoreductase (DUF899 family)
VASNGREIQGGTVTTLQVVSPDQWAAARDELRVQEAEEAKARAALNDARRRLPAVKVEKDYAFEGPEGTVSLLEMFGGRRQLITYHFMFDPDWEQGCPYCSHIIDNVGHLAHLHALDTTFAIVSQAPISKIEPFRARMGWSIPWYSLAGNDFNYDFHSKAEKSERGGLNVFLRDGESVLHTYSAYDGEIDLHMLDSSYVDLVSLGLSGYQEPQSWPRHHDKYDS